MTLLGRRIGSGRIVYVPGEPKCRNQHVCRKPWPIFKPQGTVWKCDCGKEYRLEHAAWDWGCTEYMEWHPI